MGVGLSVRNIFHKGSKHQTAVAGEAAGGGKGEANGMVVARRPTRRQTRRASSALSQSSSQASSRRSSVSGEVPKSPTTKQALQAIKASEKLPMVVVPLASLLDLGRLPRSSDGLTRERRSEDLVVFISHRWWGDKHPDIGSRLKYNILVRALPILAKTLNCPFGCPLALMNKRCTCAWDSMVIWIDFACIDQDDKERMMAGIKSLISYASSCDAMLVPVHPDVEAVARFRAAKHPADLLNYGERAWCRLENYAAMCISEVRGHPLPLFVYGIGRNFAAIPESVATTGMFRPLFCLPPRSCERIRRLGGDDETLGAVFSEKTMPHSGELTVENDRETVLAVEQDIRRVYITFAIRAECRRVVHSTEFALRGRRGSSQRAGSTARANMDIIG